MSFGEPEALYKLFNDINGVLIDRINSKSVVGVNVNIYPSVY